MIDFEIPEDARVVRNKVRKFVQDECHPAEEVCTADNFEEILAGLRTKSREQGLWCPFVPVEHGGMGPNEADQPWRSHLVFGEPTDCAPNPV